MFEQLIDRRSTVNMYRDYRRNGGKMKFYPEDDGSEYYYSTYGNVQFEEGDWQCDYNNIAPCHWTAGCDPYRVWYLSTHPKPIDIKEAKRNWQDRRQQLQRQQACLPGSYDEYLKQRQRNPKRGIADRDPDVWDEGRIWRRHMIRKQAAFEVICATKDIYVQEHQIDSYLISLDMDNQIEEAEVKTEQQPAPTPHQSTEQLVHAAVMMAHQGATRLQPSQLSVHRTRDWEFFYKSIDNDTREYCLDTIVEPLSVDEIAADPPAQSITKPSKLRTQTASTLTERIRQTQHGIRKLTNKQRMVNAIVDTGAQVTTMPESAVSRMPSAHNHRDAPPGTAVKYGNGEIETIEKLVDIGHYEVQVTPDNCQASLISVDQLVQDGHTVTFAATNIVIADDTDRYRLSYPRVPSTREWTVPMQAMEELTVLRREHPRNIQPN
jgi:uncharacterized protein